MFRTRLYSSQCVGRGPAVCSRARRCQNELFKKCTENEMTKKLIQGIYAAVLTPRNAQGDLDEAAMVRQLEFLLAQGIHNFAINGATGEYCFSSLAELKHCLHVAKATLPGEAKFLCGVGAASLRDTLALGRAGMEAGAIGLLMPAPYFFPYAQDDVSAFVRTAASELPTPIMLYNLPQFTTGFETATATALISECDNVIGIKDSSGSLDILRALTQERIDSSRIIGNDGVLAQAITEGICDGVVSGVACVLPEVIHPLFTNSPRSEAFQAAIEKLNEFIAKIDILPVPWGLKAIAEARGLATAAYQLPVSAQRAKQIHENQEWFKKWILRIADSEPVAHA
ncbi:MAG: dihydrodipicolinate synthase family protein [Formivibrio sp.]|nr:dihydrodipicolinate synthase family protein [Formivibrio sp.]